jgi:hypothetical protein
MSLSAEQQAALDEMMALVPTPGAPAGAPPAGTSASDFLQTWLGVSGEQVQDGMRSLLQAKNGLERQLVEWAQRNPLDAAFEFIGLASVAFYQAEKNENPKIKTYMDAFYYIATCASVGYADIFAVTQTGRAIASLVMIVGPALAAKSLDRPETK